jgi:hypothetical protein
MNIEQEIQVQPQPQNTQNNKTILVIIICVLLTTIVVGTASYLIFGKSKQSIGVNDISPVAFPVQATPTISNQAQKNENKDIINDFIKSSYRVIVVLQNPFAPYSLEIAAERSDASCGTKEEPQRCNNDSGCGSIYTSRKCYFFVEPQYVANADPSTRFVGEWSGGIDGLSVDSIKFKDADSVQFSSAGGDGPIGIQAVWSFDLKTGKTTQISRKEIGPNK